MPTVGNLWPGKTAGTIPVTHGSMAAVLTPEFVFAGDEDRPFSVTNAQSFAFVSAGPGATPSSTASLRNNAVGGVTTGVVAGSGVGALAGNLSGRYAMVPTGDPAATIGAVSTAMAVDALTRVTATRFPAYGTGATTSVTAVCPDATGGFFVVAGQTTSAGAAVTGCSPMGSTDVVRAQTLTHVTRTGAGQYDLDTEFLSVGTGSAAPSITGMVFDAATDRVYVCTADNWQSRTNTIQGFDASLGFAGSCLGTLVNTTFTPTVGATLTGRMYSARFQGTISGNTLTVASGLTGRIMVGSLLPTFTGVPLVFNGATPGLRINGLISGTGGLGTYSLNFPATVASPITMFALGTTLVAPGVGIGDVLTTAAVVPSDTSTSPTSYTVTMTSGSGLTGALSTPARVYALQDPVWLSSVTTTPGPIALTTLADGTPTLCLGGSNGSSHNLQGYSLTSAANSSGEHSSLWAQSIAAGAPASLAAAGTGVVVVAGGTGGSGYIRAYNLPASGSPTVAWTITPGASCTGVALNPLNASQVLAYGNFTGGGPLRVMSLADGSTASWYGAAALPTVGSTAAAALAATDEYILTTTVSGGTTSGSCLQRITASVSPYPGFPQFALLTPSTGTVAVGDVVAGCGTYAFWAGSVVALESPGVYRLTLDYTLGATPMSTPTATFTGTITDGTLTATSLSGTISTGQTLTIATTPAMSATIGVGGGTSWGVNIPNLSQEYATTWTLPDNTGGSVAAMSTNAQFIVGGGATTVARTLGGAAEDAVPPTGLALVNGLNGTLGVLGGGVLYAANVDAGSITALAALTDTEVLVAGSAFTTILGVSAARLAVVQIFDPANGSVGVTVAGPSSPTYLPASIYAVCPTQLVDGYYVAGRRTPGAGPSSLIARLNSDLTLGAWNQASGDTVTFVALAPCEVGAGPDPYVAVAGWETPVATDFGVLQLMDDATGAVRWSFGFSPQIMTGRLVGLATDPDPTGLVYGGGSGTLDVGTPVANPLLAFNKTDGTLVWIRPPLLVFDTAGTFLSVASNRPVTALSRVGSLLYVAMGPGSSLLQPTFQAYDCSEPAPAATFTATYVFGTGSSQINAVLVSGVIVPGATLASVDGVPFTTIAYVGAQISGTTGGTGLYTVGWATGFIPNAAGNTWVTHAGAPTLVTSSLTLPVVDGGAYALVATDASTNTRGFCAVANTATGTGVMGLNQPGCPVVPFAPSLITLPDGVTAATTLNVSSTLFDAYTGGDVVTVGVVVGETSRLQTSLFPAVKPLRVFTVDAGWGSPVATTGGPSAGIVDLAVTQDGTKNPVLVTGDSAAITVYTATGSMSSPLAFSSTAYSYPVSMARTYGTTCQVYPYVLRVDLNIAANRTYATVIRAGTLTTATTYQDVSGDVLQAGLTFYKSMATVTTTIVYRTTLDPLFYTAGLNLNPASVTSTYAFATDSFTPISDMPAVVTMDGLVAVAGVRGGRLQVMSLSVNDMVPVFADVAPAADAAFAQILYHFSGTTLLLGLDTAPAPTLYRVNGATVTSVTPPPEAGFVLEGACVPWGRSSDCRLFLLDAGVSSSPPAYQAHQTAGVDSTTSAFNTAVLSTGAAITLSRAPQAVYATDTYLTTAYGGADGSVYTATFTGGMWQSFTAPVVNSTDLFVPFSNAPSIYVRGATNPGAVVTFTPLTS
jgi:hypothetical protein